MRVTTIAMLLLLIGACSSDGAPSGQPDSGSSGGDGDGDDDGGSGVDSGPATDPGCGPHNCDGCCDGDECRPGNDDDSCGGGGAACQACGEWGACGEASICEVAGDSRWDLLVESATVSASNREGGDWDGDGDLPDVYARVRVFDTSDGAREEQTDSIEDLTPAWNQTVLTEIAGSSLEGLVIELLDSDGNADDSIGICHVPPRLEDLDATIAVECGRSVATGGEFSPPRAGWTVRYRLIARSSPRDGAPPLDRHAAPVEGTPGACTVTEEIDGAPTTSVEYDDRGRVTRQVDDLGDVQVRDCVAEDRCELTGSAVPEFHRLEPGPFGMREIVADNKVSSGPGFFPDAVVTQYDSLGRQVVQRRYLPDGQLSTERLSRYSARRKEVTLGSGPAGDDQITRVETVSFDERGSPIEIQLGPDGDRLEVERDDQGLPIARRVVESDDPDRVGVTTTIRYAGRGCAAALAAQVTSGPLRLAP